MPIDFRALTIAALAGCANSSRTPLAEYTRYNSTERYNDPASYIAFLRTTRFTHGELDDFPEFAVIFHGDPVKFFPSLSITQTDYKILELGTTDPSLIYIIRRANHAPLVINRGMPGAGGIATQTAELIALGAQHVVHIGTSGLLGPQCGEGQIILSSAAYKDGGAVMVARPNNGTIDRLSRPDAEFNRQLEAELQRGGVLSQSAIGYTIPICYFQPAGLIQALLSGPAFANNRPDYLEMEESPFFETAARMNAKAASLTVGADRYTMDGHQLRHDFLAANRVAAALGHALSVTTRLFDDMASPGNHQEQKTCAPINRRSALACRG